jgi:PGF-pre-PGF domain-containing protein
MTMIANKKMTNCGKEAIGTLAQVCALVVVMLILLLAHSAPALAQNPSESSGDGAELPDLTVTAIKPYHYWSDEDGLAMGEPYFNLQNYVNVTVRNNGTATAETFDVALYADDELIRSETIADLAVGKARELRFSWSPDGEDPLSWTDTAQGAKLTYQDTNRIYTLSARADEDEEVQELNESNNERTREQKVVWNGFAADQPLEEYAHDVVHGGVIITTGDAVYRSDGSGDSGTVYGSPYEITYRLQIPGSTKLARFYLPYTWARPKSSAPKAPKIRVSLRTSGGSTAEVPLDVSYNDVKGDLMSYKYHAWGTYAYDITKYLEASGMYVVIIENLNDGSDTDFTTKYSFAAPVMLVVYENQTEPKREYWITEGADILMGGREKRSEGGFLGLEECRNSAEFAGEHLDQEVEKAILGAISPWADDAEDDLIEFNGVELGRGLYNGYFNAWREDLPGLYMEVGADEAQQGMATIDVTRYLEDDDNEVIQGDDGDNMMPANAFLVITYKEEEEGDGEGSGRGGSSAKDTATATATATPTPASAAPTATVTKASRTIPLLEAGIERAMIFQDMDVSLLALEADTDVSDAKVVVERVEKPYEIPEPLGIPYVYLDISVAHDEERANIEGRIEFKVAKSWITANNIAEVTLNRYHKRDGWTALPTSKVGEEENATVYFEAETAGFSIFAVTAEEKVVTASTPSPRTTPTPTSASTPPPTPAAYDETQIPEAGGASVPGFELAIALCMLIGGAHLFLIRKRNH